MTPTTKICLNNPSSLNVMAYGWRMGLYSYLHNPHLFISYSKNITILQWVDTMAIIKRWLSLNKPFVGQTCVHQSKASSGNAPHANNTRLTLWSQLAYSNPCRFLLRFGLKYLWISLKDFLLHGGIWLFWWWSTDCQNMPISFHLSIHSQLHRWLRCSSSRHSHLHCEW